MSATLNIGLTAYYVTGGLVFVKVPSERGRYMLTDMSVIAVECPHCGALIGEPCRRGMWRNKQLWVSTIHRHENQKPNSHGIGVHCIRKTEARRVHGCGWQKKFAAYKVKLDMADVNEAMADAADLRPAHEADVIDFAVTRKVDAT
jgi:hypothetical protein